MSETPHTRPDLSYGDYLALDELLAAQRPRSDEHDELLFIVIHQTSELWLKLSIHELAAARGHIAADDLGPAFKMISRVSRIQGQLIQSWDVLATMTPYEYGRIRPHLGQSSGFQSHQYRMLEFLMGAKDAEHLRVHEDTSHHEVLLATLTAPSLYCRPNWWSGTGPGRMRATRPWRRRGWRSIATPNATGTSTSWRRSWWTWNSASSNGGSRT
jgi:tryptophan 2,3-dioxygenase